MSRFEEIKERRKRFSYPIVAGGMWGSNGVDYFYTYTDENMALLANAPTDIEWLIEEVQRLERRLNLVKEYRALQGKEMYDFLRGND